MARPMPEQVRARLAGDLTQARAAFAHRDSVTGWQLLEEAHVLSQPWAWPHVRVHLSMLAAGVRAGDWREVAGQVVRTAVAGPGSFVGRYPVGNTGRARVPATQPMPMSEEIAKLLEAPSG